MRSAVADFGDWGAIDSSKIRDLELLPPRVGAFNQGI